jgi:hypothetical protein
MMSVTYDGVSNLRLLISFEEVIRELGGVTAVSKLTRSSKSSVCNWRHMPGGGRFPARHYWRMHDRLRELGCVADRGLWGFTGLENTPVVDVIAA